MQLRSRQARVKFTQLATDEERNMDGRVLYVVLALVAASTAASISGLASIDLNQASAGGQVTFPRIPGINSPLPSFPRPSQPSNRPAGGSTSNGPGSIFSNIPGLSNLIPGTNNRNGSDNGTDTASNNNRTSNNFNDFISAIPGLRNFLPGDLSNGFDIDGMLSRIPGFNGTNGANFTVPNLPQLPDVNDGPYIPGVSEALGEARRHIQAMFNITGDISTGMRDVIQTALGSEHPSDSIRIILDTIAKVYSTVAANCPMIIIGDRVISEGMRLGFEVMRSIGNIAVGRQNNIMNSSG